MKKYTKPVSHVIMVETKNILAGSLTGKIGNSFNDRNDVGAKSYFNWDDEEYEDY